MPWGAFVGRENEMKKPWIVVFALIVAAFSFGGCIKVVEIGHEGELTGEKTFNAAEDVEAIWASKAVPELKENAVDLKTLLTEAGGDLKSTAAKYGRYSMGDKGELSYIVKGEGTVTEVNREKKAGFMTLKLADYDGPIVVRLQTGPVYKGSAVRDTLSFIKYEDYKNQVDWAKVSQAIHAAIDKEVIEKLDMNTMEGKTISFTGCFSVTGNKEILVTPIEIEMK